jgi:protein TonB
MMRNTVNCFAALMGLALVTGPAFAQASDWQRKCATLVASKQTYPRAAQMRGDEGTAKVKVSISATGEVTSVELVGPSGSSVLDREAVALPAKVGTFPAPPGGPAMLVVPLTWKLL